MDISTYGGFPGVGALTESAERIVWWGGDKAPLIYAPDRPVLSSAVDAGNTPTTTLRPGLLLGLVTASKKLVQWDSAAVNGSQDIFGVLLEGVSMLNSAGIAEDKIIPVLAAGPVKASQLLIKGTALTSHADEQLARRLMSANGRFIFDDDISGGSSLSGAWAREVAKTANYTILAADNGTLFTNAAAAGAVIFTLPAIKPGFRFAFRVVVDQNFTVTKADGNVVALNNAAATSVAFSTVASRIGGGLVVESNQAGTLWLVTNASAGANAVTVA